MKATTLTVDKQGRVMLPAEWRRKHALAPSSRLTAREARDGSLLIEPLEQGYERAKAMVRRHIPVEISLSRELIQERQREAELE
jgi:AbrB family looped-hinge helix DNA binding protein